jgi:hypothetical protein
LRIYTCTSAILVSMALFSPSLAEAPIGGSLHNKKEASSLSYQCVQKTDYLECEMVKTSVRRKSNPADFAFEREKAIKNYPELKKELESGTSKSCAQAKAFSLEAHGIASNNDDLRYFSQDYKSMTVLQKSDVQRVADSWSTLCEMPTEENFLKFTAATFDVATRTCSVNAYTYKQRFKKVGISDLWVVAQDGPKGMCGEVDVSRFELDAAEPKFRFWKFFSRTVVTNKPNDGFLGKVCGDMDESEHEYNWLPINVQLGCDYITFDP